MKTKCIQYEFSEFMQFPLKKKEFCTSTNNFYRLEVTRVLLKIKCIARSDDRVKGYRNCLMRLKEKETSHLQRRGDTIYNENLVESIGTFHFKARIYNCFLWGGECVRMYECIYLSIQYR